MRLTTALALMVGISNSVTWADEIPADDEVPPEQSTILQVLQTDDAPYAIASGFKDAHVTMAVTPRYPKKALSKKIDGEVTLEFDISRHGRAENIEIIEQTPDRIFGAESEETLEYWAFSPARLALCGTTEQKARQTIRFVHDGDPQIRLSPLVVNEIPQLPRPTKQTTLEAFRQEQATAMQSSYNTDPRAAVPIHRVEPEYPLKALERRKEGMVALVFLIEVDGSVSNIEVVDTVNGLYFQKPSLKAIRQWNFKPHTRKGRAVDSVACHEFIFHADEYKRSGKLSREREERNIRSYGPN